MSTHCRIPSLGHFLKRYISRDGEKTSGFWDSAWDPGSTGDGNEGTFGVTECGDRCADYKSVKSGHCTHLLAGVALSSLRSSKAVLTA